MYKQMYACTDVLMEVQVPMTLHIPAIRAHMPTPKFKKFSPFKSNFQHLKELKIY